MWGLPSFFSAAYEEKMRVSWAVRQPGEDA
jgi:hypothetical protein